MKRTTIDPKTGFHVIAGTPRSQSATMVVEPGSAQGGATNRHRGADQWLYVLSGTGTAVIDGSRAALEPGTLLLIEAGESHEIRADADGPLSTLNFYGPPAY